MDTQPPKPKLRPPSEPIKIEASWDDLERLGRAHHELDRARLMLSLAIECDQYSQGEHRRMLIDAADTALKPAFADVARVVRMLRIRVRVAREASARRHANRTEAPLPERQRTRTKKFHSQAHRR
ncbi:MAG TPA: hypothetical protein VFF06_34605 [Polyangia bacterium]|nr:hypothetical protein [Polyangia bacterium]